MGKSGSRVLVACFSHAGENYSNGGVVELTIGNTAVVAQMIAEAAAGELFEIKAESAYPYSYAECTAAAKAELEADSRPKLAHDTDVSAYDTVCLGYPNWWGTMPMPVKTFLCAHDFSGKTVLPFCTHEGSGMGDSEADLKKLVPGADVRRGLAVRGSSASAAAPAVKAWLAAEKIL